MARPIRAEYDGAVYHVMARYGFSDGSGVYRAVERLEALGAEDRSLGLKLKMLESRVRQANQP